MNIKCINIKLVFIFLLYSIIFSCKPKYKYINGLDNYLVNTFKINYRDIDNAIFYFLPINECNTCQSTNLNIRALESIKINPTVTIVVIGKGNQNDNMRIKNIDHTSIIFDSKSLINNYQTGIFKPLLIHFKNGKVNHFRIVDDFLIEEAKKILSI